MAIRDGEYGEEPLHQVRGRSIDLATSVGLLAGFAMIAAAIMLGGNPDSFINIPSILIVIGGTIAVTTVCYSVGEMIKTLQVIAQTLMRTSARPYDAAKTALQVADLARKQGVLSLQNVVDSLSGEPFFRNGMAMVIDGTPPEEVEAILRRDLQATQQRHRQSASVLRKMAEFAPAMGLIGTLIGLVQMLGNLQDPSTIGPAMAVALLTTFYGAVLANMVFLPLASKLERNSAEESLINQIYLLSSSSISRQENPRRLELLLNSILPPAQRIKHFD
ncbi:MAG: MotA/TolQ/ExbB proton channel family protein [Proteobacteria bacterium]|nr:MotA/TolQ/ExbB proton channel family protein [Pseudomonadota bacterium]